MENSNGVPSPPLNNGAFDTGSTTQSNTPIVQSNAQDLTDQIKGNEINNRQNFNSKMIETSVEETPGVLSTLAALQFAANSVTLLVCSSNHLMSLIEASKSGMLELIKGVRKRLDNTNFSAGKIDFGPREASYDLDIFSRELGKIVDSVGLLESSLISQVDDIRRRWLPLLHALFFCGTAAVLSGRQEDPFINGAEADNFKVTFLQSFLPVACAFWLAANRLQPSLFPTEQPGGDWLEGGWNMMCLSSIIYNTGKNLLISIT